MNNSFLGTKKSETLVATSSTKSNVKRRQSAKDVVDRGEESQMRVEIPERVWRISAISIFCLAAVLRLYDLNLVPLHHDEGVNGNFLLTLVRDGRYQYDPANYHGPTLYYIAAIIPWIIRILFGINARDTYGLNTIVIRLIPALFGLATIWLVFLLRRRLGTVATLAAALLLAISPGAVYLSRYFIHESLFVFFTLGIVVAGLKFYEARNPIYLVLAAGSAAMLFATKETAMISAGVLIIALGSTQLYQKVYVANAGGRLSKQSTGLASFVTDLGGPASLALWLGLAVVVFIVLNVFLYTSFFQNYPKGIYDALSTFKIWTKTGKEAHVHPPATYLYWLTKQESCLLFLGSIGAVFAVFKPKNSFALFSALWAFGLIAAYSLVPYKTPWLALNFIVPLALIAGYAVQRIFELEKGQLRLPIVVLVVATVVGLSQTIDLNFINYDNDNTYYVYVYAHSKRGLKELVDQIDGIAKEGTEGGRTGITIVSREYWPLPWYLRNYSRVGYFGHMTPSIEPIIVASEDQRAEMDSTFGGLYQQVPSSEAGGVFALRPGVNLLLYTKRANP
jgi:uncharacterized protein (TIGR03663 family)